MNMHVTLYILAFQMKRGRERGRGVGETVKKCERRYARREAEL